MRNLELKVRCPNGAALAALAARALAGGAVYLRTMGQRDTYFVTPRDRLKLREWWREEDGAAARPADGGSRDRAREWDEAGPAGAVLIAYRRPDRAGSRYSDYLLSPVDEPRALGAVLTEALGVRVVVEKRRVLHRYGDTRIHLDLVADLGAFVELETVLASGEAEAVAEHRAVAALLGLDALPVVAGSYSDLLAGGQALDTNPPNCA